MATDGFYDPTEHHLLALLDHGLGLDYDSDKLSFGLTAFSSDNAFLTPSLRDGFRR